MLAASDFEATPAHATAGEPRQQILAGKAARRPTPQPSALGAEVGLARRGESGVCCVPQFLIDDP